MHLLPQDQVYWYLKKQTVEPLRKDIKADVVIIGGGMAGLQSAYAFSKSGLSVVLLEKSFCGAGASGKSSGFITPDSELSLYDLKKIYGEPAAQTLWQFVTSGVELIRTQIQDYKLTCDYAVQDTLVVANTQDAFQDDIKKEFEERSRLGYTGQLYTKSELGAILGSDQYEGGVSYPGTFGIQAFEFCQQISTILRDRGVQIYEESPALSVHDHTVKTPHGQVSADRIIICMDKFAPDLDLLTSQVYHAQTFLMLSEPLTQKQIEQIFPERQFMVWDTDLIYQYYRVNPDNRLMLGGASLWYTYARKESHNNSHMANSLITYFKRKFPQVSLNFEYIWPGLIGLSKDIMPIAGPDKNLKHIYYIAASAGLPWAAALGAYSFDRVIHNRTDLDSYFDPYRTFPIGSFAQKILGTQLSFALSNGLRIKKWA